MTISTQSSKAIGRGNGVTTAWPYTFVIPSAADVLVRYVDASGNITVLTPGQYSISGLGLAAGGTVNYPLTGSPIATGASLVIERNLSFTQPTKLENQGGYFPAVVEATADRLTMLVQQLKNGTWNAELALTFPSVDVNPTTTLLPAAARANKYLSFDSSGNPTYTSGTSSNPDVSGNTALPTGGILARTLAAIFADFVNVKSWGAVGDGSTDDTAALVAAVAVALSGSKRLYFPRGLYVVKTAGAIVFNQQLDIQGDGRYQSLIYFRPTGDGACFTISAGASRVNQFRMSGLGFYSDDTTHTKVAIDAYDLSACQFRDILVVGSGGAGPSAGVCWSGAGSMGIRTHGREAVGFSDIEVVADKPFNIAANPNTAANDNEDCDHFNFHNIYALANGFPVWTFDLGIGASNASWSGYQAWVGGTKGIFMADTRVGIGLIRSRHLSFENVRHEQCTDALGFAFDLTFTSRIEQLAMKNVLISATSQGISLDGYEHVTMENVSAATLPGANCLLAVGAISVSSMTHLDCNWPALSLFTTTGMTPTIIGAWRVTDCVAPATAIYSGQIPGSKVNVEKVIGTSTPGSYAGQFGSTTGGTYQLIPQVAGNGVIRWTLNNALTDFEPTTDICSIYELRYRTGVGLSATCLITDTSGNVFFKKGLAPPPSDGAAAQTARISYVNGGAPNNANGNDGDICYRKDGGAGTTMYHKRAGVWVGVV